MGFDAPETIRIFGQEDIAESKALIQRLNGNMRDIEEHSPYFFQRKYRDCGIEFESDTTDPIGYHKDLHRVQINQKEFLEYWRKDHGFSKIPFKDALLVSNLHEFGHHIINFAGYEEAKNAYSEDASDYLA